MAEGRDWDTDRREAARLLWAAFLADLDAAFARRGSVDWTVHCLAMLDNADAPAGREFLAQLVAARRERAADPLTVVATSRGSLAYQLVPRGEKITRLAGARAAHAAAPCQARRSRGGDPLRGTCPDR